MTAATSTSMDGGSVGPVRRVIVAGAGRLHCTEGQLQTFVIGLLLALVTGAIGLPPVFEDHPLGDLLAAPPAAAQPDAAGEAGADAPAVVTPPASSPPQPARPAGGGSGSGPATSDPAGPGGSPDPEQPTPTDPALGVPGVDGACTVTARSIENPHRIGGAQPASCGSTNPVAQRPAPPPAAGATTTPGQRCSSPTGSASPTPSPTST